MLRSLWRLRRTAALRLLSTGPESRRGKVVNRAGVQAEAEKQREIEHARRMAEWASRNMLPWERAQMDVSAKPLKTWERVYWRLFLVFGTVGFAYETYVLGNRRVLWKGDVDVVANTGVCTTTSSTDGLYRSNNAFRSHHLMSDAEASRLPVPSGISPDYGLATDGWHVDDELQSGDEFG